MQAKLKEMIMVQRPTDDGIIPSDELESLLNKLGYGYLTTPPENLKKIKTEVLKEELKEVKGV